MARPRSPLAALFAAALLTALPAAGQTPPADPPAESPEVARERTTAERFLALLERNPRPGTALDRAYAFYAERGELAALADGLRARTDVDPGDVAAPAVLGLIEARRGNDAAAVAAFRAAADRAPDDPNPRARLAEALVLTGDAAGAAAAYEAALARDPARRDLPDLLAGLGRVLARSGKGEEAGAVWDRLEAQFPGDDAVRERIAAVLEAEGDLDAALARYAALAEDTTDDYRRVTLGLKAAELKVRTGRTDEAVRDFERLLSGLNPDGWLYREVRGGIERAFLRTDDLAGLTSYYEGWIGEHPEDVAAMARLGELLDRQRRTAEARDWLERAVAKAPTDGRLRRALIDQQLRAGEYAAAAEQFEELDGLAPGHPDVLRDWGTAYLDDPELPADRRLERAEAVWRKRLDGRADDPVAVTQVADWLRQAGAAGSAEELYRRAVDLAPDDPRYREYLGEYLHALGRSDAAVEVWNGLAAGPNRSVPALARLSEVLGGFGYADRAADAAAAADELDASQVGSPDPAAGELEFADRVRFAGLFAEAGRADAADAQLAKADALAVTPEECRVALAAAVEADETAGRLADRVADLETAADANPEDPAVRLRLAAYREAAGDVTGAADAAAAAVRLAPADVTALTALSELQERAGRAGDAAESARRLADLDRPRRADHLTRVAELRLRLGQRAEALRTARQIVAASPGTPRALSFLARVAFAAGDDGAGLDALRRAARGASGDPGPLLELSAALADRFRTDEAVALLWRAFGVADGADDRGVVVRRLADLARRQGRFEAFLAKLEREAAPRRGRPADGPDRETALLLAEAHLAADDPAAARGALEPLLARDPRDTVLLARLVTLAERAGDADDAIGFQKRVVDLSDEPAERMRLAGLLTASGDAAAAERLYLELLGGTTDPAERLAAIDKLLVAGRWRLAYRLADDGLGRAGSADDWELLVRLAAAAANAADGDLPAAPRSLAVDLGEAPYAGVGGDSHDPDAGGLTAAAADRVAGAALRRVWSLDLPDDAPGAAVKATREADRSRRGGPSGGAADPPPRTRYVSNGTWIALMWWDRFGMDADNAARYRRQYGLFSTAYYGHARNAAIAWLGSAPGGERPDAATTAFRESVYAAAGLDRDAGPDEPFVSPAADPTEQALWDADALLTVEKNGGDVDPGEIGRATVAVAGALFDRPTTGSGPRDRFVFAVRYERAGRNEEPGPLSAENLARLRRAAEIEAAAASGASAAEALLIELQRAGLTEEADERATAFVAAAESPADLNRAARTMATLGRAGDVADLLDRAAELPERDRPRALPGERELTALLADRLAAGDPAGALAVVDAHADATADLAAGGGSGTGPRRVTVSGTSNNRTVRQIQEVAFPPSAAPIGDDQVNLLYSLHVWLRSDAGLTLSRNGGDEDEGSAVGPTGTAALSAHLAARAARPDAPHRWHDLLRLASVRAWDGDAAGAAAALAEAQAAAPDNAALRRVAAAALSERGDPAAALALLDAAEPAGPDDLRDRELLALRTAAPAGRLDRARAAADRLFGLRLSEAEQLELAAAMRSLSMTERAAAVLNRLRRGGSSDADTLSALLTEYRRAGDDGVSAEVARSILDRVPPVPPGTPGRPPTGGRSGARARAQAVRVLKELGGLAPILADLRDKLDRNPNAAAVRADLIDLLVAAGERAEVEALLKADRPTATAPASLMAAADRLRASGDAKAAAELYERVVAADPSRIGNDYWQLQRTAQTAGRTRELMEAVGKTDPADWGGNAYALANMLTAGLSNRADGGAALDAFASVWERHPEARAALFESATDPRLLALDGVYDYARDRIVGTDGSRPDWAQLSQARSWSSGTGPDSTMRRVLAAAKQRGELDEVAESLREALEQTPDWHAGRAVLAAALAAAGDAGGAREQVETLLALPPADGPTGTVAWSLSVDLEEAGGTEDLQLALMRRAVEGGATTPFSGNGFEYEPASRLTDLLVKNGRTDEARRLLLDAVFDPPADPNRARFRAMNAQYATQQDLRSRTGIGRRLTAMGLPTDALRVLSYAAAEPGGDPSSTNGELERALREARAELTPDAVADTLRERRAAEERAKAAGEPVDPAPALDLLITATDGGQDLADAAVRGGLIDALTGEPGDEPTDPFLQGRVVFGGVEFDDPVRRPAPVKLPDDPAAVAARLAPLREAVAELSAVRPDDQSLHAAAALLAFAADDTAGAGEPVAALARLAAASAGEPSAGEVGAWWLTGREAVGRPETATDGAVLTAAALAAAADLPDPAWRTALRVGAGRAALAGGDAPAAERVWTDLLGDLLDRDLPPAAAGENPPDDANRGGDADPPGDPSAAVPPAADETRTIPVTTGPRARRALRLAGLAADAGLTDLSLRAVRETLGGGPPLGAGAGSAGGGMFAAPAVAADGPPFSEADLVRELNALSASWAKADADPAAVTDTLLEVVLPTARPTEAFVLPAYTNVDRPPAPPGDAVAPLLDWAARAGRLGAVAERAAARPANGPAADLFAARIAVAAGRAADVAAPLTRLAGAARRGGGAATGLLAVHAALPALNAGLAPDAAFAAFEAGAEAVAAGDAGAGAEFLPRLAREAFARGEAEKAVWFLDRFPAATAERYANYGEQSEYLRREALVTATQEAARGGAVTNALERLAELDDFAANPRADRWDRINPARLAADLARGAAGLPPEEAFAALLAWSVPPPAAGRPNTGRVRALVGPLPADGPPAAFGRPADPARAVSAAAGRPPAPLTGTAVALAAAAVSAGRTADLAAALDRADAARRAAPATDDAASVRASRTPTGSGFAVFVPALGRPVNLSDLDPPPAAGGVVGATVRTLAGLPADLPAAFADAAKLRGWAETLSPGRSTGDGPLKDAAAQAVGANVLLVWAAMNAPETRDAAFAELAELERWAGEHRNAAGPFRPALLALRAEADVRGAAPDRVPASGPAAADFGPWRSAAVGGYAAGPPARPPWVLLHGSAYATGSAGANLLMFRVPLAGSFGLEVVAADGDSAEAAPVYGGLMHEAHGWNDRYRARDFSDNRYAAAAADWLEQGKDRRLRFEIAPESVTLRADGRRVFRDDSPAAGSPFVGLAATDGRRPTFRSVRVIGGPTVPRSVDLLAGDRTDGWFSPAGGGAPPRPGLERVGGSRSADRWAAAGGVLTGEADAGRLVHHRPLFDGDRVAFEFRTAGTAATVVPSLDRVGFVLDPAGVRLRFLPVVAPEGRWEEDGGLSATATVPAPGALGPVPLRADDWNRAELAADGGRLTLSVNGTAVLSRDLAGGAGTPHGAAHADRLFGFAPAAGRRAEVRAVTLTGDWPDALPAAWKANLLLAPGLAAEDAAGANAAAGDPLRPVVLNGETVAAGRAAVALISHGAVTHGTWELLVSAAGLPPDARLGLLAGVVLPNPADPDWRADHEFSPADPPPGTAVIGVETPTEGRRVPTGGRLLSPVLALVDAAEELGRLDDLRAAAEARPTWGNEAVDIRACLLAAVAARSGGDPGPHVAALMASLAQFTKGGPDHRPRPHLIAARALADAALADPTRDDVAAGARALATAYLKTYENNFGGIWFARKRQARRVLADLDTAGGANAAAALPGWVVAPEASLVRRARGVPPPAWAMGEGGVVRHLGGAERDRLFAVRPAAPAAGAALTVAAEPTVDWFASVRVLVGGIAAQPAPARNAATVRTLAGERASVPLDPPVELTAGRLTLTQTVAADRFAAAVNGAEVWATALGTRAYDPPLPFLALQARGDHGGSVRGLRVSGESDTPASVDLLPAGPGRVPDWWLDAHDDADGRRRSTAGWAWDDGGLLAPTAAGADRERLLTFPRPLAAATETVRFEFFQPASGAVVGEQSERAGVHAALGSVAFVLTDAGVRVHRVTAGPTDRAGLAADNLTDEPAARRGPDRLDLAPDRWHAVQLAVAGDTAALSLNGTVVFERPLAPANRRTFGLFRWAADRPVRVRGVTLSGDWSDAPPAAPGD